MTLKEFVDEFLIEVQLVEIYPTIFNGNPIFAGIVRDLPKDLYDFSVFQVLSGVKDEALAIFLKDVEVE